MTDTDHKRMLEMAAKAAGVCLHPEDQLHHSYGNWGCDTTCMVCKQDPCRASWHPLTDDGDALRLAVALHIGIRSNGPNHWQNADETIAIWDDHEGVPRQLRQAHDGDPRAATRTAVVRAAAAIGEQMP